MARFFYDIHDNDRVERDETGVEQEAIEDMRNAAISVLPEIARDELPNGDEHLFAVSVRDEAGRVVFRASLKLETEWVRRA